ncbi:MAG: sigma-E factor negative regulatory protein [Woeseia sp.]|nr:sigma-E factor negative regulatory protein [Woeseia sp.]
MNDAIKMQVSAFVDGELPAEETELLIRRLGESPELKQQAAEYFAIGRLLRGERSVAGAAELPERVAAALADETVTDAADAVASVSARWMRPAASAAIAASVALLALAGLRQLDAPEPGTAVAGNTDELVLPAESYTEPLAIDVMADWPNARLTQYYLSHGESSGELGANGILSRLVTLELRGGELVEVAPVAEEAILENASPNADNPAMNNLQDPQ